MRRINREAKAALAGVASCLAIGLVIGPVAADAKPARVKVLTESQREILRKGAIKLRLKGLAARQIKLRATSRTFDKPKQAKLSRRRETKPGKRTVKLRLGQGGRAKVRSCEPRKIKINGRGARAAKFELRRNRKRCRPRPIDLSRAGECSVIALDEDAEAGLPECMLPFPDEFHTVSDETSATGRRVAFDDVAMPSNAGGEPIDAAPYNLNDGFSPGQTAVIRVPGLDTPEAFAATAPIGLDRLSRNDSSLRREPVVVIDATAGERWPIWVELDSNASTPEETALLIHPARNYEPGHRYIVALRNLKDDPSGRYGDGDLPAPEGFRYFRDRLRVDDPAIDAQRGRFESVFRSLRRADIKRRNLYLAWDFTVSSDENTARRLLHMRDDAFAELGDTSMADAEVQGDAPEFAVTQVQSFTPAQDPELARRVQGTFEVPCYLEPDCNPGARFELGPGGLPTRNGTYTAKFNCGVPHAALAAPGRPQLYGHGLLGTASQATSGDQQILGQTHNFVICATDEIGFSSEDIPNIASNILPDLGNFPELTDRVQQGLLNELFLGRLMIHAEGFASDAAFHVDPGDVSSPGVIDPAQLYYNGNSQGGILGGALTAVAPDFTRSSLGVPAMNYSVLLNRSVDFDLYKLILDPAYPSPLRQQLALSMIQMLWDRSDPNGYAHRMTSDPLPGTPPHEVLLNVAFGDHQVTTWQADVEARTIGAAAHEPVVYDGRWPSGDILWDIPRIERYPHTGSAIVYWDSGPLRPDPADPSRQIGTDPPPIGNIPNKTGEDPHGDPRVAPAEMQMVSDFLRPHGESHITDTCNGMPCFAGGFSGPGGP